MPKAIVVCRIDSLAYFNLIYILEAVSSDVAKHWTALAVSFLSKSQTMILPILLTSVSFFGLEEPWFIRENFIFNYPQHNKMTKILPSLIYLPLLLPHLLLMRASSSFLLSEFCASVFFFSRACKLNSLYRRT